MLALTTFKGLIDEVIFLGLGYGDYRLVEYI
jgi:hypothetical protein